MQNQCAEIKIRAERRGGELIPEQITVGTKSHEVTLSDLDISKMQSHRWQTIAKMPEEEFEKHRYSRYYLENVQPGGKYGVTHLKYKGIIFLFDKKYF